MAVTKGTIDNNQWQPNEVMQIYITPQGICQSCQPHPMGHEQHLNKKNGCGWIDGLGLNEFSFEHFFVHENVLFWKWIKIPLIYVP